MLFRYFFFKFFNLLTKNSKKIFNNLGDTEKLNFLHNLNFIDWSLYLKVIVSRNKL